MRTSRDAVRARELEREAEATDDPATWAVTADAWEEAGEPQRAWYAFVRSRGYGRSTISYERAEEIRVILARADARLYDVRNDVWDQVLSNSDLSREWNAFRSQLEVFAFMTTQPFQVFAYDVDGEVVTFMGDVLGTIDQTTRPLGHGGRIQHVRVVGANGYTYVGTETGTYCRLRRGKPWLR